MSQGQDRHSYAAAGSYYSGFTYYPDLSVRYA